MYFAVLIAFSMVFMPIERPPWPIIKSFPYVLAIVVGQTALTALWAAWSSRRILRKLDKDPARPGIAQRQHSHDSMTLSALLLLGLAVCMWLTDWPAVVRDRWNLESIYGLDEFVMLLPFFSALILAWACMYPAERALRQLMMEASLWDGLPVGNPWSLPAYLLFQIRHQLLIVALPMMLIVITNDIVQEHVTTLRRTFRIVWIDQVFVVIIAGVILFFAPLMLRAIWSTSVLPDGPLRRRLQAVGTQFRLRYRNILIWHSQSMIVNAAVMGVLAPVRYVLLSDGLIEKLEDDKIEAVFGHEVGHVKHHHIPFYVLFSILSMLIVGGVCELAFRILKSYHLHHAGNAYITWGAVILVALVWGLGFGWISRRFERQADLYGARVVTPPAEQCDLPCRVHHAETPEPHALCACAARTFAGSLQRIAWLNGIPEEAYSWRHSSIANRMNQIRLFADNPDEILRFGRVIIGIKIFLVLGTAIGLAIAAWLYWPF